MKVLRLPTFKKTEVNTIVCASDWHSFYMHEASYSILKKLGKQLKTKKTLVINGDFMDCEHLMPRGENFKKWIGRDESMEDFFIPETDKECNWANNILDEVQKIFHQVIFISGNHDWRIDNFGKKFASAPYKHYFDLKTRLKLNERKIKFVDYNSWLDVGNLSFTHGMYHSTTASKKHYEAAGGRDVIYGHVHRASVTPFISRGQTKHVWSLPCMSTLNPQYLKNSENNWTNGFAIINFFGGNHYVNIVKVKKDTALLPDGTVLKA